MNRRNQRRVYGTPYEDPAGSEVGQEADEPRRRRSRGGSSRRRPRVRARPARIATGYGVQASARFKPTVKKAKKAKKATRKPAKKAKSKRR